MDRPARRCDRAARGGGRSRRHALVGLGASGGGSGSGVSFVPERAREAVVLLSAAAALRPETHVCLAGDDHVTSRALLATAAELGEAAGDPQLVMAGIASTERAASAGAVAARIRRGRLPRSRLGRERDGCGVRAVVDPGSTVGRRDLEDEDGRWAGGRRHRVSGSARSARAWTSPCRPSRRPSASCTTFRRRAARRRDRSRSRRTTPGRLLIGLLQGGEGTRGALAEALGDLSRFRGLAGTYAFGPDGSRASRRRRSGSGEPRLSMAPRDGAGRCLGVIALPSGASCL